MLVLLSLFAVMGAPCVGFAQADAPAYDGPQFPGIYGPDDPEDYSWTVSLGDEQTLRGVDDQHAMVRNSDGTKALDIWAEPAHDTNGAAVPTTIAVSERDVITVTVHHRAGNPAAGGTPFSYPIFEGVGWAGGFNPIYVPLGEELPVSSGRADTKCLVPRLKNRSLDHTRRILNAAHCSLGSVHNRGSKGSARVVVRQGPKPGTLLLEGSPVWVIIGSR
jgi:hypothetical protein